MTTDRQPAPPFLEVSLVQSGKVAWRMSIPLLMNDSLMNLPQEWKTPSTLISTTGSSSTTNLESELDEIFNGFDHDVLMAIAERAFDSLSFGDGDKNPILLAMEMMRDTLIYQVKELFDGN